MKLDVLDICIKNLANKITTSSLVQRTSSNHLVDNEGYIMKQNVLMTNVTDNSNVR